MTWNKTFGGRDMAFYRTWKPVSGKDWEGWEWRRSSQGRNKRKKGINGTAEAIMKTSVTNTVRVYPKTNKIELDHRFRIELSTYHSRLKRRHGT